MRASVAKAQDAQFQKRTDARRQLGHWEGWRDLSAEIRQHVIKHLPDYLEEFSDNVQKNGGHVFFAKDGDEASAFIKQLAIKKNVHHVVKSKSMVTTEIGLDKELLTIPELSLMETDLAEFILQEDNWDEPTHIVFPTLHKNRNQIQKVFEKLGYDGDNDPEHMARFVRHYLRNYFMQADFGITGCNFAIADNGMINLVTNEGNADISMAIPKTQVVVMGMERIVPSLKEAEVLDNVLCRSAVGQKLTSYCTFSKGKEADEADGPDDFYVVIVDNGRSKMLNTDFEPMLQCIRCGSCLNVCPACTETCPVKIPLHELIRHHRYVEMDELHLDHSPSNALLKAVGKGTSSPTLFNDAMRFAHIALEPFGKKTTPEDIKNLYPDGKINHLPAIAPKLAHGWVDVRDLAVPPKYHQNFRHWYRHYEEEEEQKND